MNYYFHTLVCVNLLLLISLFNCTNQSAGIETTNGATVVVCAKSIEGTIPPFASVYVFDKNYIPYIDSGLGIATAANEDGYFLINGEKFDTLSVAVISSDKSMSAIFNAGSNGLEHRTLLERPGIIEGTVMTNEPEPILVYIYGTGYYVLLKSSGVFEFKDLPQGTYILKAATVSTAGPEGKAILKKQSMTHQIVVTPDHKTIAAPVTIP
jgi:hypothetical protein